jgi:hypothetical protein
MATMTYELNGDYEDRAALEQQRARMRETLATLRADRLSAAAEREERWLTEPGLLSWLRSRRPGMSQSRAWPSLGSRP